MFARAGARTRVRRRTRRPPVRPLRSPVPRRPRAARHCRPLDQSRSTRLRCPHSCALADPTDKRTSIMLGGIRLGLIPLGEGGDARIHAFIVALAEAVGTPIDLHHAADYRALTSAIEQGLVHFAWLPPLSAARAVRSGAITPAAVAVRHGTTSYYAGLVALESSSIHSISDLKGLRAAWVDRESASGYVVIRAALRQQGVSLVERVLPGPLPTQPRRGRARCRPGASRCRRDVLQPHERRRKDGPLDVHGNDRRAAQEHADRRRSGADPVGHVRRAQVDLARRAPEDPDRARSARARCTSSRPRRR